MFQWFWYWAIGRGWAIFEGHERKDLDNSEQTVRTMDVKDSAGRNYEGNGNMLLKLEERGSLLTSDRRLHSIVSCGYVEMQTCKQ